MRRSGYGRCGRRECRPAGEDPVYFVEPWVWPTRVLRPGFGDGIQAERSYREMYEEGNVTSQLRR